MKTALLPNFTPIPNTLLDVWMSLLSGSEYKIISVIARQTYGWIEDKETGRRKISDWISYSQFREKTGLKNDAIANGLKDLEEQEYISLTDAKGMQIAKDQRNGRKLYYRINNRTFPETGKVEEKETANLSGLPAPTFPETGKTKETNTKENIITLRNGFLKKLPNRETDTAKIAYLTDLILTALGDEHSRDFYKLVASKVPETKIREALAEIKADGADNPPAMFTYKIRKWATFGH